MSSVGRCTVLVMMIGAVDQHRPMEPPRCRARCCPKARKSALQLRGCASFSSRGSVSDRSEDSLSSFVKALTERCSASRRPSTVETADIGVPLMVAITAGKRGGPYRHGTYATALRQGCRSAEGGAAEASIRRSKRRRYPRARQAANGLHDLKCSLCWVMVRSLWSAWHSRSLPNWTRWRVPEYQ